MCMKGMEGDGRVSDPPLSTDAPSPPSEQQQHQQLHIEAAGALLVDTVGGPLLDSAPGMVDGKGGRDRPLQAKVRHPTPFVFRLYQSYDITHSGLMTRLISIWVTFSPNRHATCPPMPAPLPMPAPSSNLTVTRVCRLPLYDRVRWICTRASLPTCCSRSRCASTSSPSSVRGALTPMCIYVYIYVYMYICVYIHTYYVFNIYRHTFTRCTWTCIEYLRARNGFNGATRTDSC